MYDFDSIMWPEAFTEEYEEYQELIRELHEEAID